MTKLLLSDTDSAKPEPISDKEPLLSYLKGTEPDHADVAEPTRFMTDAYMLIP